MSDLAHEIAEALEARIKPADGRWGDDVVIGEEERALIAKVIEEHKPYRMDDQGEYLLRASIGSDSFMHAVVIKFDPDVSASLEGRLQALVDPEEALRIAANIITHAKSAMQRQIWDLKAGECETCSNSRFVDGKRSMREHCPDCVPKTRINPPTTAKVAELMAEVL